MSRGFGRNAVILALILAGAQPVLAETSGSKSIKEKLKSSGSEEMQKNSEYCDFTYYTDAADNLDFKGGNTQRCFDMKGGDDVLILNREEFLSGVKIYTGEGRDTVWLTNADDLVWDIDGNDREIRTYEGNDTIHIELPVEKDPFRGIGATERTVIRPGAGSNVIHIGENLYSNAFARYSPDIWLTTDPGGEDHIEAICGRPTVEGNFDIRSLEIPETSSVSYDADGCNIGIFGLYGDADIKMSGGRLAIQTYSEGFRVSSGENLPQITGEVSGGLGIMLDIDKSDPKSLFNWEGVGNAFVRSRISKEGSGGQFRLRSARDIRFQGDVAGDVTYDLAAKGEVKLDLSPSGGESETNFRLAGSRMDVSWSLSGGSRFPEIINDAPVSYMETSFILPDIDWYADPKEETANDEEAQGEKSDTETVSEQLPSGIPDIEAVKSEVVVVPGNTRLRLQLRQENDRFGKCVSIRLIDYEKQQIEEHAECLDLSDSVQRMIVENAQDYEEILISGDGVDIRIPINAASHFTVDRIEAEL